MFGWSQENYEEIKKYLDNIDIKNMCSWLLRFSPAELPIISTIIGLILNNQLTGRETLVIGNFIVNIGHVMNLQAQQKLLIQESSRNKLEKLYVREDKYDKDIYELRQQLSDLERFIRNNH